MLSQLLRHRKIKKLMDRILYFSTFSIYNVQMRESFFNMWIRVHSFSYFWRNSGVYFLVLLVKADLFGERPFRFINLLGVRRNTLSLHINEILEFDSQLPRSIRTNYNIIKYSTAGPLKNSVDRNWLAPKKKNYKKDSAQCPLIQINFEPFNAINNNFDPILYLS